MKKSISILMLLLGFLQIQAKANDTEPIYKQRVKLVLPLSEVKNVWQADVKGEIQVYEDYILFIPKKEKHRLRKMKISYAEIKKVERASFGLIPNRLHIKLEDKKLLSFFTYKRKKIYEIIQTKLS